MGEFACLIQLILENTSCQAYKKYCMILIWCSIIEYNIISINLSK